ncbi:cysteine synthase family protein [Herbaspirillum sp. RTI4]|uniref:cysteine synthase family protein n=1 Tax=Herbaspirillum sp. RTI4 TaxID=3048640 RepID=UPI002AB49339|nr:cysteine synthase family protein [Herbaspirillum sp. RTI4]MDY7579988.1 cysteine synthase family protein [Herbaspirillum sp. RTI4]MEA9982803.1 cysteine synthase family protein [Herbaspirillum sp. RTI4]
MDRHPLQQSLSIVTRSSDLIGNTPLLELIRTRFGSRLLLKLEQFNPTGSAKIRIARQMLDEAEQQGLLKPGGWVIESTSGNTGMGLALLSAERGYRFTAVVDRHAAADKIRTMQAYGAEIMYVDTGDNDELATADREALAAKIAAEQGAYWTEQHNNPANGHAYRDVAEELQKVLGQEMTHLVGAVGTGGSLFGTARVLKTLLPALRVIGVEPHGSIAFGGPGAAYYQSGTGTPEGAEIGALVDYDLLDEGLKVSDRQAFNTSRYLARKFSLMTGGSAGGVIYQAIKRLEVAPPGSTLVVLVCDGGEKYLDTVFNDEWMDKRDLLDSGVERELDQLLEQITVSA